LGVIAAFATLATIIAGLVGADLGDIILATSACLLVVTVAGLAAGFRLLPSGRPTWWGALFAAVAMGVVTLFSGFYLALPLGMALAAMLYTRTGDSQRRAATAVAAEPAADAADGPADWPEPIPAVGTMSTELD
jgi:MFS superfamily sulfate permease-like transporter